MQHEHAAFVAPCDPDNLFPYPTLSLLHPLFLKKIAAQLNKKKKERKRKSTIKSPYFSKFIREIIKFEKLFDIGVCLIHKFSLFAMLYLKVNCETKAFVVVVVLVKNKTNKDGVSPTQDKYCGFRQPW